jgi:PAS domain S-box-containing protein
MRVSKGKGSRVRGNDFALAELSWDDLVCEVADGVFTYVNPVWRHVLGWKSEDILGHHFREFLHPSDVEPTQSALELSRSGEVRDFVNRYRHRDGRYVWLEWRGRPWGERQLGVGHLVSAPSVEATTRGDRSAMSQALEADIASGRIQVWFQPVVKLPQRSICGYEALLRRVSRSGKVLPAGEWLPLIESVGLMTTLTSLVVQAATDFVAMIPAPQWVAINGSIEELGQEAFADELLESLARRSVDPRRMVVEISEHLPVSGDSAVDATARRCADAGVHLFMDDFGTSYAALTHLRDYPISGLKLDRSFVADLPGKRPERLVKGVQRLARDLAIVGIAEGVETVEQERSLMKAGWTYAQGWLYGAAQPAESLDSE